MEHIEENQKVLFILNTIEQSLTDIKKEFQTVNGDITYFVTQNFMIANDLKKATFDVIVSGYKSEAIIYHSSLLTKVLSLLKPGSKFVICDTLSENSSQLEFELKVNGFINTEQNNKTIVTYKPNYEIGSSKKLNLGNKPAAAVWKLNDDDEDEVETIDPDNLLEEDDLIKPDPSSLRVCGTTGQRKACKDCSCGLADEIAAEKKGISGDITNAPKSSCGSCYLGDAFRCATCPYLGMPAFKPGEKIQLSENQLKADI